MRKFLILVISVFSQLGLAQVGIGTTTPTPGYNLDVAGDLLVQKNFNISALSPVQIQNDGFKFLFRALNSTPPGEVTKLDMTTIDVGPINIANYKFINVSGDNLESVNLQFDATKYIVGIADIRYIGSPVAKTQVGSDWVNIGYFVARSYINNGTWHLEMRNRTKNITSGSVSYEVTVIVYDRRYFRELNPITTDFNGSTYGSASTPIGL